MFEKIKAWFLSVFDANHDGKISAEDAEVVKAVAEAKIKEANQAINDVKNETKRRVKRVKEELADVKDELKEVVNQVEDVVDAAKGGSRKGRKKKV